MRARELAAWNDAMVEKYHAKGTLFESPNPFLRFLEWGRLRAVAKLADARPGEKVLDLGCGEGFQLTLFPPGARRFGLDISRRALEKARKALESQGVPLVLGDARQTCFKDACFDKITCSETLEHVPEPEKVAAEAARLLKPGGLFVVSVPDEDRIQGIMRLAKALRVDRLLGTARKGEDYEWHLQHADEAFVRELARGRFDVEALGRTPPLIGYRFVARLRKKTD